MRFLGRRYLKENFIARLWQRCATRNLRYKIYSSNPALKPGQTVIMDNASFHKSQNTGEMVEEAKCHLLLLSPYSPDLNPIEKFLAI
ncbi:hypothetical protein MIDIC_590023 [Alphaproteobacteria bacterium]